jgi:hypothetical protein
MSDPFFGFDPTLPITAPLANVFFAFAVMMTVGAVEERSAGLAAVSVLLVVAGVVACFRMHQAKKSDEENTKPKNNSNRAT